MDNRDTAALIFDLDGTLYFQKPVRLHMFVALLKYFVVHFWRWKELYGIYYFRRIRENVQFCKMTYDQQIMYVSRHVRINQKVMDKSIQYWMFQFPLLYIEKYRDEQILNFLNEEQKKEKKIIIYSDYPVEEKLKYLKIIPDYIFYPGKDGINEMKPSMKSMEKILKKVQIEPKEMLYIGDRIDKDGKSAELVNMPFILVHKRTKWWRKWFEKVY